MESYDGLQFVKQFEHFIFIQVNMNQRWCRDNTEKIKDRAIFLKQLLSRELKSRKMKRRNVKKIIRKVNKWKMFHKIYGLNHKDTLECFEKVIYYIEKYEDLAQEDDDSNDDDDFSVNTDESDEYEGYADDEYGDINSFQEETADESWGYDKKFVMELRTYQVLLDDVQRWLKDAQTTISREIKLTSKKVVKSQIRGIENLEKNLCARSAQLEHLLKGVLKLTDGRDGQSLANHMIYNLGSVFDVMEGLHLYLRLSLEQLQETLEKMVIEPPKRSAREFLSDLEDILSVKTVTLYLGLARMSQFL